LSAGLTITPASSGGVAACARASAAYSAWSSRQYGCTPASSSYSSSPQVKMSDGSPGMAPRVMCSGER
jgi:hypothetical protein